MGTFCEQSVSRLTAGCSGRYDHWFGGPPTHDGVVPQGRRHPVHLLYNLDLRDPQLGLASRFPHLSRLPLYNALQYNCCDMVYRVVTDNAIRIVSRFNSRNPEWFKDHPYDDYPASFPRMPVVAEAVSPRVSSLMEELIDEEGDSDWSKCLRAFQKRPKTRDYPFTQVGGRHFMWQGIPEWDCLGSGCQFANQQSDAGKEVLAVIWGRPIPALHLWDPHPESQDVGSCQIIVSRCTGCGALHSCNRCD